MNTMLTPVDVDEETGEALYEMDDMDTPYTDAEMRRNLGEIGFVESELEALALLKDYLGIVLMASDWKLYMGRIDGDSDGLPTNIRQIGFIYDGREPHLFLDLLDRYPRFSFPGLYSVVKRYYGIDIPRFKSTTELRMKLELLGQGIYRCGEAPWPSATGENDK